MKEKNKEYYNIHQCIHHPKWINGIISIFSSQLPLLFLTLGIPFISVYFSCLKKNTCTIYYLRCVCVCVCICIYTLVDIYYVVFLNVCKIHLIHLVWHFCFVSLDSVFKIHPHRPSSLIVAAVWCSITWIYSNLFFCCW